MNSHDKRTILVIDNDADLTLGLAKRLGAMGYHCITAASGAQGLAQFQNSQVDMVISDLNMPGGDGVDLATAIRRTSEVPIIFVTGFRDDFKRRLRHIANVTTLQKPFDSQDLISLITAAFGAAPASACS